MLNLNTIDMTITGLQKHYQQRDFTPAELLRCLLEANKIYNKKNPVWIHLLSESELDQFLISLEGKNPEQLPLYGIPFAIKDNIDLAGIPTTAACHDFSYVPTQSAFIVKQLLNAGAIPLGKTNLDQFATGLVGVRSPEPWGPCHNALNDEYISGGSSSGSAVTVSKGLVSFSLGTDTAGSGRVPASLNNIVGLKPSKGLFSTSGVVPACRSLDCVTIFTLNCSDANRVFDIAASFDELDPYARVNTYENSRRYYSPKIKSDIPLALSIGVPPATQLNFFGNREAENLFNYSISLLKKLGVNIVEIDFDPFIKAARLLYEGPWVAERYLATRTIFENSPESMLPVIQTIISGGKKTSALECFQAQYQLQEYMQLAQKQLGKVDAIVTPTNGTTYTIEQVLNDPFQLNSNMGYYTNFMNLLDCAAIAVPTGIYQNGVGFGVTLFHRSFSDKRLLELGASLHQTAKLPLGATTLTLPTASTPPTKPAPSHVDVVVCGAHLEGMPLNWQLQERGATLMERTTSSADYKLYALAGGPPFRPGMMRAEEGGQPIEVEIWRVPMAQFGSFVAEIPAPLGIGKVQLQDGRWESGFICEACGLKDAQDITKMGSWKRYQVSL